MSRPRSAPIGWHTGRMRHCYKMIVPMKDTGAQLRMHRRLTPTLRSTSEETERERDDYHDTRYETCEKILVRQRPTIKVFTCHESRSAEEVQEITDRLYSYNPDYRPAESKRHLRQPRRPQTERAQPQVMLNKPIYSTAEVRAIVSKLQKSKKKKDDANSREGSTNGDGGKQEKQEPEEVKVRERHAYYTAQEVQEFINKVRNDPARRQEYRERVGSARPCSFRSRSGSLVRDVQSAGPRPTKEQVDGTTYRMTQYDNEKVPAESKGHLRNGSATPKRSASPSGKSVSAKELDVIVERLNTFNHQRWPPESRPEKRENKPEWNSSTDVDR